MTEPGRSAGRSPVDEHKAHAPERVRCVVCTVSDSKTPETDTSGRLIRELLAGAGHEVISYHLVRDEPSQVHAVIHQACTHPGVQALIFTGGTGIAPRDQTFEAVDALLEKRLPGFGELFRLLSYQEAGRGDAVPRAGRGPGRSGGLLATRVSSGVPARRRATDPARAVAYRRASRPVAGPRAGALEMG